MIREFFGKILSIRTTPRGAILTFLGEEYIPAKSVEGLTDSIKILEAAMEKRIMTIKIMETRLQKNKDLIERMHKALEAQNRQLHEQMDLINTQRQQLRHIDQIDWRMNKLKMEHKKLKKMTIGD
ncbi:MAG: hypothetical protein K6E29_01670 [Cyanobacteria bacterium RUI128]|nr:hypothetical protein [Cyanobacteria bacterium RUI128]